MVLRQKRRTRMSQIKRAGPSPAILVAVVALVAALGGTALAGSAPTADPAGKLDKALKMSKKALKKAKKNKKSIKNIELTPGPQGEKGDPASTLWAHVDADDDGATLIKGSGVVDRSGPGKYEVVFDSDIIGCALFATLSDNAAGATPAGEIAVAAGGANSKRVFVDTKDSAGTLADQNDGNGFMVMALC